VVDSQQHVELANPMARRIFGVVPIEAEDGTPLVWQPPDQLRQPLTDVLQDRREYLPEGFDKAVILKGGYVLSAETGNKPDLVLVATGSEVGVAVEAKTLLAAGGVDARVVSMPSLTVFWKQPDAYRESTVPQDGTPVAVIEAGVAMGWSDITRSPFLFIGMNRFGASAPAEVLAEKFGFTGQAVSEKVLHWLKEIK